MKNRKLYAILTLVAFMMTILPMAAFAAGTTTLTTSTVDSDTVTVAGAVYGGSNATVAIELPAALTNADQDVVNGFTYDKVNNKLVKTGVTDGEAFNVTLNFASNIPANGFVISLAVNNARVLSEVARPTANIAFASRTASEVTVDDKTADADGVSTIDVYINLYDAQRNATSALGGTNKLYIWAEREKENVSDVDILDSINLASGSYTNAGNSMVVVSNLENKNEIKVSYKSSVTGTVNFRAAIADPSASGFINVQDSVVEKSTTHIYNRSNVAEFEATSSTNWNVEFIPTTTGLTKVYNNGFWNYSAAKLEADGVTKAEFDVVVKDAKNNPVKDEKVTLSINKSGADLDTYEATTDNRGKIDFAVTATKADEYRITAEVGSTEETVVVKFLGSKPFNIEISDQPSGPIALDTDPGIEFKLYDIHGNLVDGAALANYVANDVNDAKKYTIFVTKPSNSNLKDENIEFKANNDVLQINFKKRPDKVGDYKIKASLANGKYVEVPFTVKEQGKIVKMTLDIKEASIAWNAKTGNPTVKLFDADGTYKKESTLSNFTWTVDNTALATVNNGIVTAKDGASNNYRTGTVTVTAIDTRRNLTAVDTVVVGSDVATVKVAGTASAIVGETATAQLQIIDADGNEIALNAANKGAIDVDAYLVSAPAGAKIGWDLPIKSDYQKTLSRTGKLDVKVTSDTAGDVTLQVIIKQDTDKVTLSVPVTVKFGSEKPAYGAKNLTLFIGSTGYVVDGNAKVSDLAPFIKDDRTFVPVRLVATALGATNEDTMWDAATETVTLVRGDMTATLKIGNNVINVVKDGVAETVVSDVAAFIDANTGRTVLPFRAIAEVFGAEVEAVFAADGTTTAVTFAQ